MPSSGLYNTYGPGAGSNEPTVSEPYPYTFFADKLAEPFTPLLYDTLQVDFYPKNLLREFTFLIYDISGATRISQARGAISGMAGAYKMYSQELNPTPSTVLFGTEAGRVQWKSNAQTIKWTQSMLNSVFPSNATLTDWPQAGQDSRWPDGWDDPQTGWTGDWVMGTFCTFGPVDIKNIRNNLTVEVISQENGYYFGLWGNVWTDNVREQIEGAMGVQGTRAEQLAWRKKNGGFDIVIFNDGRLNVPEGPPASGGSGGFEVNTDDWKNVDVRL
ncbi:hypothetical protein AGMMS49525_18580 [Bacteroidia bacterium]|nr:hypothetical protein AGMMS49525_18580 [Bacteroidia bacterium]